MKKSKSVNKYIFLLTLIIILIWTIFNYLNYTKYDNVPDYSYTIKKNIDINYHNSSLIKQYYENVYRISSFAREQWYNYDIDVRTPDHENPQSILANQSYDQMLSEIAYAEQLLTNSYTLKSKGFDNKSIKQIETSGKSAEAYTKSLKFARAEMTVGDKGKDVEAIQIRLDELEYKIPITGLFSSITEECIIDFQLKNKLFPTGVVDQKTLQLLITD
ncbi:MAG: peptidoglycan-binding protein [Flavobacteriales bacterium]|nr:peptidoglycan-binding protein [Flavobacteriales bacterium]